LSVAPSTPTFWRKSTCLSSITLKLIQVVYSAMHPWISLRVARSRPVPSWDAVDHQEQLVQAISIVFFTETWRPDSFYSRILANRRQGLHTLCLLDIKVKEPTLESLARGRKVYEAPRYMTINTAVQQLLEIEDKRQVSILIEAAGPWTGTNGPSITGLAGKVMCHCPHHPEWTIPACWIEKVPLVQAAAKGI
jgi:hypothetical protein